MDSGCILELDRLWVGSGVGMCGFANVLHASGYAGWILGGRWVGNGAECLVLHIVVNGFEYMLGGSLVGYETERVVLQRVMLHSRAESGWKGGGEEGRGSWAPTDGARPPCGLSVGPFLPLVEPELRGCAEDTQMIPLENHI